VAEVHNLIRGASPQPGAWTTRDGAVLKIFECARKPEAGGAPGEVVEVSGDGFTVAAGGGAIAVGRVQPEGEKKIAAGEYAAAAGVSKGDRLG
jgi:methionyl-tRNA formyltransferase